MGFDMASRSRSSERDELSVDPTLAERLHDGPIQSLTAGSMWLLLARRKATDPEIESLLEKAQDSLAAGIRDIRRIMDGRDPMGRDPEPRSVEKDAS